MNILNEQINLGNRRIVGQSHALDQVEKIFRSDRLSHAYLITGPDGSGKTPFALAMAEAINGIDHLTDLKGTAKSKKSSWYTHPDIHVFIPLPTSSGTNELKERIKLLAEDPYKIVDFTLRPDLNNDSSSKNKRAFYYIDYYRDEIRPKTVLKPNEGRRTVMVITGIDTMRKEAANAFLKLLEEPAGNVMFILTADKTDQLLPTIMSRCQQIRLAPLSREEISDGLQRFDGFEKKDADFLARISDGNYALCRYLDLKEMQKSRAETVDFLRYSYTQDAPELVPLIEGWQSRLNLEGQIALSNTLEQLLRDIMIYRETQNRDLIINVDQLDVIKKFCKSLGDARLEEMIEEIQNLKQLFYNNVQFKLIFTALAFRFGNLMRGTEPDIPNSKPWQHLPAYSES
ncbi:AAA family ATPase [Rhodohalobacter sp. SW132]|uniref:DNA polymerase III subunit n=1 Tax=Rhodohalobacter sp. SW132 TaxID=2293433 RepID=UPI000E282369|nr:DNA polymerase III subunit delta' C-terminal domain-containing protein [Rhodohalobacter sp. SW132]REL38280.1 AAA family ATPase [Rhodohalobacter sp. SW132]